MAPLRRRQPHTRRATLLATIASSALLSACFSTTNTQPSTPSARRPLPGIPAHDIATITTDVLIERHRGELERLADATRIDDIERGGVILYANGRTELVEIHNSIRDGPELIDRYVVGEHRLNSRIYGYLDSAVNARINCEPSGNPYYCVARNQFKNALHNIPLLLGEPWKSEVTTLRIIYKSLALHTTYLRDADEYELVSKRGKILFHIHTHHDGNKRETTPHEDPLRPSRQDLLISDDHEGIIPGVDAAGRRVLYYTHKGAYRILRPDAAVAMR